MTISFWVKPDVASQAAWVFAEGNDSNSNTAYVWGARTQAVGKLNNFIRNDNLSVSDTAASSGDAFIVGQWHHVLITDQAGTVSIYIDGSLDSNSGALGYSPSGTFTLQNSSIGAWIRGASPSPTINNQFDGLIDDVAVYNRVLNNAEIAALAAGADPLPPTNAFSDWIGDYFPGVTDPAIIGLDADPDGDGIDNGVENYFGTPPDEFSEGLVAGIVDADENTFTFTHPLNDTPASDLTATYRWSTDLQAFYNDGVPNGAGTTTVTFSDPTPDGEIFSVTATITGSVVPSRLFIDVTVAQE